jgi:hypothetical protein
MVSMGGVVNGRANALINVVLLSVTSSNRTIRFSMSSRDRPGMTCIYEIRPGWEQLLGFKLLQDAGRWLMMMLDVILI